MSKKITPIKKDDNELRSRLLDFYDYLSNEDCISPYYQVRREGVVFVNGYLSEKQKPFKIKTYVLIVSRDFMKTHPRAGQPTNFRQKIAKKQKIHTIRANYQYWADIAEEVNNGWAVVSVRQWTGKPYNSPEEEIMLLTKIGVQRILFNSRRDIFIDHGLFPNILKKLAKNDGLRVQDFNDWFKEFPVDPMAIIHFTDFRY